MELLHKEKELVNMYLSAHPLDSYRFEMDNFCNIDLAMLPGAIEDCTAKQKGMKVCLACLVSSITKRLNKAQKPFADVNIEDFNGNYSMRLFSKSFEAFGEKFVPGTTLLIEGRIDRGGWRKPEDNNANVDYELKIDRVMHLGNASEEMVSSLTMLVPVEKVDKEFEKELLRVLKSNKGKTPMMLVIVDTARKMSVQFKVGKFHATISTQLIDELRAIGVEVRIDRK